MTSQAIARFLNNWMSADVSMTDEDLQFLENVLNAVREQGQKGEPLTEDDLKQAYGKVEWPDETKEGI